MKLSKNLFATVLMGLSIAALANEATISTMDNVGSSIKVNCNSNPKALKSALERRVRDVEKQRFVITG
ncbi:hypothetical protein [Chitinibacter sp. GC72]|uniref:hypothetical protein n=1 Tax=Chitinibacter sp. GC72 TaxID=1526917 RepID=UPI0012FC012F|nr:hypothetical protein [Chitinibacter sp. GC72]